MEARKSNKRDREENRESDTKGKREKGQKRQNELAKEFYVNKIQIVAVSRRIGREKRTRTALKEIDRDNLLGTHEYADD